LISAYTPATFEWPGWRARLPGGPLDGKQQHGYLAATVDPANWHQSEPNFPGHGSAAPWDNTWGGTGLDAGENLSDYVYRSSAEMRPRANANGGANTVFSLQTRKTAGYAVAPGNYRGLGRMGINMVLCPMVSGGNEPGCGAGPPMSVVQFGPGATNIVAQPAPTSPAPTNLTPWTVPPVSPQPSPTVSATPTAAAPSGISAWLSASTVFPGVENLWIAGGAAALLAWALLRGHA